MNPTVAFTMPIARLRRQNDFLAEGSAQPSTPQDSSPTRLARMFALAVHVERLIDAGELIDHADAARRLGLTRARLSQVAALTRLPIDVQEQILLGTVRASERDLRGRRRTTRVPSHTAVAAVPATPAGVSEQRHERTSA